MCSVHTPSSHHWTLMDPLLGLLLPPPSSCPPMPPLQLSLLLVGLALHACSFRCLHFAWAVWLQLVMVLLVVLVVVVVAVGAGLAEADGETTRKMMWWCWRGLRSWMSTAASWFLFLHPHHLGRLLDGAQAIGNSAPRG